MKKRFIPLLSVGLLLLAGCNGTKKVDKEAFYKDVAESVTLFPKQIEKEKITGWIKKSGGKEPMNFTVTKSNNAMSGGERNGIGNSLYYDVAVYKTECSIKSLLVEDATYYIENGYRIVDGKKTYAWDENFNLTRIKLPDECDITIKYTYAK